MAAEISNLSPQPSALASLRKPMAKVTRVSLYERELKERLSLPAVELLLDAAEMLSEGNRVPEIGRGGGRGGAAYYGSTMLTIDLARAGDPFRECVDVGAVRKLVNLVAADPRVGRRVRSIAERESTRLAGAPLAQLATDLRVRAQGTTLFLDVDFEGTLPA